MNFKPILTIFATVIFCFTIAFNASGQGTTSRITGTVTDSTGAAVEGATITLTNEGTGTSLTTQTGDSGSYTFDLIPAGTYSVSVERQGFKRFVSKENAVNINQPATVNISMEVGGVAETVTVQGTVEAVQTGSSGNLGSTIDQRTVESLPIVGTRGRNPLDLLNFQPGVVNGANVGGGVHVNGSRDRAFNFTLDGIDINESTTGGSNFTPLRPNPDSIQEFQIVTSNFTAELGRSSGAQVTFVTRSGTNRLTGNAFEYYQTPEFNANEYENNLNGRPKNQFVQHIFGGSVGGPIIKDKFFFFSNIQLLRSYDTVLVTRTVYTQAARNGLFRFVQGGQNAPFQSSTSSIDAAGNPIFPNCSATVTTGCIATYNIASNPSGIGIDPAIAGVINSSPLPNNFTSGDGLNTAGFNFGAPQREKQYDFVAKFDYNIADNQLLYVRYAQGKQNTFGDGVNGGRPIFPNSPNLVDTFRAPKNLAINYRWSPTATLTNEFIFGLNKFGFRFENPEPDATIPYAFANVATPNTNFSYNARSSRTLQYVDNLTWIKGNHTVKGGINFRQGRAFDDRSSVAGTGIEPAVSFTAGTTTFGAFGLPTSGINTTNDLPRLRNTINDLLGRIGSFTQAFVSDPNNPSQFAPAGTRYNFVATYPEYDFYAQDTWKFRPNLTFDLGLRWEFKLAPKSDGRPILAPDQPFTVGAAPTNTLRFVERKLFNSDLNNFSPSVGFAWDPFKSGKTSIRANYRLAYDRFPSFLFSSSIFQSTPGNTFQGVNQAFNSGGNLLRNGLPNLAPTSTPDLLRQPVAFGTGGITVIDPDLKYPEIHQYALSFQREVFKDTVVEVSYIGKHGTNLFGGYDSNQANLLATDPRCGGQTFLDAFRLAQDPANTSVCLAGLLTGGANTAANTTAFRSQFSGQLAQNSVAAAAASISGRSGSAGSTSPSLVANGFSPFFFQKFPQYSGSLNVLDSNDLSRYNGLEFILKRRFNRGLGFQVGYTFSKSNDTRSFDPTFSTVSRGNLQSASSTPFDINNRRLNYAPSDFDRRHVLQATYVYELPFGRGRMFATEIPKALDYVIGGWQIAGNLLWSSGRPFTVYSGANTFSNVVQSTAECSGCNRHLGKLVQEIGTNYFFSADQRALFSLPAVGSNGNTGRNFFIGPRFFTTDVSLTKKFKVTERFNFDLRLDAKNATNNPSFGNPVATFTSTTFGRIRDGVTSSSRRMQVSLKLNF
ncbi:MAG: carboxypeptidase regulatory-like domain-containing protein [Pyrinomonadaceae bacterium]